MSRLPAFPRAQAQTEHFTVLGGGESTHPPRQAADDLVRLRVEMLAILAPAVVAGKLNWQDIPECLEKLEKRVTAR